MEQVPVPAAIMLPINAQFVSLSEKPEPITLTSVIAAPDDGLRVMLSDSTVKLADAESPAGVPAAVTQHMPATLATVNIPFKIPLETEQVGDATTLPDIEQVVSLVEKPEPET
jgi:hypothetical protein